MFLDFLALKFSNWILLPVSLPSVGFKDSHLLHFCLQEKFEFPQEQVQSPPASAGFFTLHLLHSVLQEKFVFSHALKMLFSEIKKFKHFVFLQILTRLQHYHHF